MALAQVQAALARLFTERQARAAFARDPVAAGLALGLDRTDAQSLAAVAPRALERFAATLRAKRALDAGKLLPLTALALGEGFAPMLRETLAEPPPGTAADALALVDRLARAPGAAAPWIGDLARYEAGFIWGWSARFGPRARMFRYPVLAIAGALRRGTPVGDIAPCRCVVLWMRTSGGRLLHRAWSMGAVATVIRRSLP